LLYDCKQTPLAENYLFQGYVPVSHVVVVTMDDCTLYAQCAFILNVIDHCQKYLDLVKF